jgi:hypothetical protein
MRTGFAEREIEKLEDEGIKIHVPSALLQNYGHHCWGASLPQAVLSGSGK